MQFAKSSAAAIMLVLIIDWLSLAAHATAADLPDQNSLGLEWKSVASSGKSQSFINLRTIRSSGQFVKAWGLGTRGGTLRGKAHQSTKWLKEYDCAREESRYLSFSFYSEPYGRGEVTDTDGQPSQWEPIVPGSVGEGLWQFACGIHQLHVISSDQWIKVGGDDKTVMVYAAQSTKRRHGNIVKLMVLNDYLEPRTYNGIVTYSGKSVEEYDCSDRSWRTTDSYVDYAEEMGRGAVVNAGEFSESNNWEWSKVKEGTIGVALWTFACKKR